MEARRQGFGVAAARQADSGVDPGPDGPPLREARTLENPPRVVKYPLTAMSAAL